MNFVIDRELRAPTKKGSILADTITGAVVDAVSVSLDSKTFFPTFELVLRQPGSDIPRTLKLTAEDDEGGVLMLRVECE
jgi:hypothetical protein